MNVLEDGAPGALEQRRRAGPANLRRRAQELALQRCAARRAGVSAAIYSVTTTAKANGLNPRLYVEWLLTEMPNAGELTDEVVDSFLPWSDRVPESCKLDPAAAEKAKEMPDDFIINIDPDAFDDEMANNAEEGL
ncbi:MAG: transposase domain-containing protein [Bifidobacteriaceae bacterium]|nr:MAG: transposase domain-containing protein [Bifidobacteriaceae bacterium]